MRTMLVAIVTTEARSLRFARHYQRRALLCQLAKLADVLFANPQLHRLHATAVAQGAANPPQAFRGRGGNREDGGGLALGFVDLLLLVGLRRLDDALLVTLGLIDLGVPLTLGCQHHGALFPFRAHLLLHRGQHILWRRDVLDLVPHHLDAPGHRRLVELGYHVGVDGATCLESPIQLDLADLAAQRRLCQLGDGEVVVGDAVGGKMGIQHLHVKDCVHGNLDVIARYADLFGNVERLLFQAVTIGHALDERDQNVEPGLQRAAVLAQIFYDKRTLLRHHGRRARNHDHRNQSQSNEHVG